MGKSDHIKLTLRIMKPALLGVLICPKCVFSPEDPPKTLLFKRTPSLGAPPGHILCHRTSPWARAVGRGARGEQTRAVGDGGLRREQTGPPVLPGVTGDLTDIGKTQKKSHFFFSWGLKLQKVGAVYYDSLTVTVHRRTDYFSAIVNPLRHFCS